MVKVALSEAINQSLKRCKPFEIQSAGKVVAAKIFAHKTKLPGYLAIADQERISQYASTKQRCVKLFSE